MSLWMFLTGVVIERRLGGQLRRFGDSVDGKGWEGCHGVWLPGGVGAV